MLGKLIKYDLKANMPSLGLCYLAVLVLSVLMGFMVKSVLAMPDGKDLGVAASLALASLLILWIVSLAGTAIGALLAVLRRFYTNLFGDQGYLTLTLPVKAGTHVLSKLVSGVVLMFASVLVIGAGICIPMVIGGDEAVNQAIRFLFGEGWRILVEEIGFQYMLNQFLSLIAGILLAYLSLCAGQRCERHKILGAIVVFIGINLLESILQTLFTVVVSGLTGAHGNMLIYMENMVENSMGIGHTVYLLVQCGLFFWLSSYMLEKKVNLQ